VNTVANEFCYVAQPGTKYAYFASDRPGGKGGLDMYVAYPNPARPDATTIVSGRVIDAKTRHPLGAMVTISELRTGKKMASFRSDDLTGEYAVILAAGTSYKVTADAPDHLFYSERFDVPAQMAEDREVTADIELQSTSGTVRLLVYFDFNVATLTDESTAELSEIADLMEGAPLMRVELDGHTDDVGTPEYNLKFSLDRAIAVRDYIVSHGVDGGRLVAKGFGFDRPVAPNDTDEGRTKNRRVEFRIRTD
jgi:outer membrane protein OmpA-like peptidoglycan-associated protein